MSEKEIKDSNIEDVEKGMKQLLNHLRSNEYKANSSDSLARNFVLENNLDKELFKNAYCVGTNEEKQTFGFQFAMACGDYAVNFIANSDNPDAQLDEGIKRFGQAVLQLNDPEFAYSIDYLKVKLPHYVNEFAYKYKLEGENKDNYELTKPVLMKIAKVIYDLPDCDSNKRNILITAMSHNIGTPNNENRPNRHKIN